MLYKYLTLEILELLKDSFFKLEFLYPNSNCKTSLPTENAPCESPGLLEFIVSVYCEFSNEKFSKIKNRARYTFML